MSMHSRDSDGGEKWPPTHHEMLRHIPTHKSDHTHDDDEKYEEVEIRIIRGNEAFNEAMLKEPPQPWTWATIQLYCACFIGFFCATMNGYDGSLINNLLNNKEFLKYFLGREDGLWAGIVTSMYQIGGVTSLPFIGPSADTYGRRFGMWIGCVIIIIGTVVQGLSPYRNVKQFMAGRFLLGFGVNVASAAGPMYVVEVSHPAYRGIVTAIFNTFWFTGSILASGVARGGENYTGNIGWRLVVWMQLFFGVVILVAAFFLPESPRWLYVNNKQDKAKEMLIKYHGEGNEDSEWVNLQLNEYEELLEMDGADKRWWDYGALFKDRSTCYRLFCNCTVSIFGQWAGNAVLSYFMAKVLSTIGINGPIGKANIILINNCQQFVFALIGANLVDRIGRRPLLLFSNAGCCVVWLGLTVATAFYQNSIPNVYIPPEVEPKPVIIGTNKAASYVSLAFVYLFGAVYSIGFTPLQALYPVEVLSFEMRAKGMGFSGFAVAAAGLLNQFAWPVSLQKIGWRTYIIFTIWCGIQTVVIFFFIPETKNRTLEELDEIFSSRNPVATSLATKRLGFDAYGDVVNIQDI